MPCTTATARDEMLTLFYDAWREKSPLVWDGGEPQVLWQGVEEKSTDDDRKPKASEPWAMVTVNHNVSPQRTFGEPGNRRFERLGILIVQVFTPMSLEQGLTLGEDLGTIVRDAYEGNKTPSGVWFRNTKLQEVGPSDPWWQLNVSTEFNYDELK